MTKEQLAQLMLGGYCTNPLFRNIIDGYGRITKGTKVSRLGAYRKKVSKMENP